MIKRITISRFDFDVITDPVERHPVLAPLSDPKTMQSATLAPAISAKISPTAGIEPSGARKADDGLEAASHPKGS